LAYEHPITEGGSAISAKLAYEHPITEGGSVIPAKLAYEHPITEEGSADIAPRCLRDLTLLQDVKSNGARCI
ncbi:MAG: hypothetical protein J7639_30775, partial [Paenibacillaceae bacterium]|nr:hypothetical protein [Paenibacillaceae bacterium]